MTKTKAWLIVAACLVLVGCMIFGGAMAAMKWDFSKLSTQKYVTNEYELGGVCERISVNTSTADVELVPGQQDKIKVICYENEKTPHSVVLEEGELKIELVDNRIWYEYIGIPFGTPSITVILPEQEYASLSVAASTGDVTVPRELSFGQLDIKTSTGSVACYAPVTERATISATTGDITVQNGRSGALELRVSTGKITLGGVSCEGDVALHVSTGKSVLSDITCRNLTSAGDTGDVHLEDVVAAGKITLERSTGDVKLERCDAGELSITTDTGDVKGTLRSDKIFIVRSDTGKIDVPSSVMGGRCEITTDTGDIRIGIEP